MTVAGATGGGTPWLPEACSGVGSLPGTDPGEASRVVLGELALPHLVELPSRGPHADLAGRGGALLSGLATDLDVAGWRLVPGRERRDQRRARDLLARDLDAFEDAVGGSAGTALPAVKCQVTGPWTLAALLELPRGGRVLADPGAVADLVASLAEGVAAHVADLARRVPTDRLVVQLDEPSLPAVLAGAVPTASGLGRVTAVPPQRARDLLAVVLDAVRSAGAVPGVHCCAPTPPVPLLQSAGAAFVSLDLLGADPGGASRPDVAFEEAVGAAVEAGTVLLLGLVPPLQHIPGAADGDLAGDLTGPARRLWQRLGLDPTLLASQVCVTPTCGLATTPPARVVPVLSACRETGRRLREAPE